MKRSLLAAVAAPALVLGFSGPAFGADEHASCAGLVGPYYAAQGPGTHADVTLSVVADFRSAGMPPGENFSDFASFHDGSAENCLA